MNIKNINSLFSGEINRLLRLDESKKESIQDNRPSIAIPGFLGWYGAVFTFDADTPKRQKRRYGVAGGTYVSVVEFAPKIRAFSVHVFGSSADPKNRHYMSQSPLYARGEFKPAWLALNDIKNNLEIAYRLGGEKIIRESIFRKICLHTKSHTKNKGELGARLFSSINIDGGGEDRTPDLGVMNPLKMDFKET